MSSYRLIVWPSLLLLVLAACTATGTSTNTGGAGEATQQPASSADAATRLPADKYEDLEMVTLLPRDAIPAIDNPRFLSAADADEFYDPDELVIGVEFNDDARAYSVPFLSGHEIVNDTVGGVKIAVTW